MYLLYSLAHLVKYNYGMYFSKIVVIYNPNNTGSGRQMADDFIRDIKRKLPSQSVALVATEHAGHAEEIAYRMSKTKGRPLVVSSSGDGGYNEVINGIMKAKSEGFSPVAGLIPAGNANDHHRSLNTKDIVEAVVAGEVQKIDLLELRYAEGEDTQSRFAHSYIGVGLTSKVGRELNKSKLNVIKEIFIAGRVFFNAKPTKLRVDGEINRYDSIVFSNIDSMSKYIQLSKESSVTDGKFEVTELKSRYKLKILSALVKSTLVGFDQGVHTSEFRFETVNKTSIQVDGEIIALTPGSTVVVSSRKQILECIV